MPFVTTKLDLIDVFPFLQARGYGIHSDRKFAVQLNVPSKTRFRKMDGVAYRELLRGLGKPEVDAVLTRAESAEDAAMWIERLSLGEQMSAQDAQNVPGAIQGLTAEDIATIVDSRVRMQVGQEMQQYMAAIAEMRQEISDLVASLQAKQPKAAKKVSKAGKKLDPHDPAVDEAMAALGIPTSLPAGD